MTTAPRETCFVCAYATAPCARAELVGRLLDLAPELQGATLRLELADGSQSELTLRPPWQQLVGDLERHGLAKLDAERPVTIAAYHLQREPSAPDRWLAGHEALVVLEPEWLEDVTSLTQTQYCERRYLVGKFQADAANEAILRGTVAHATFRQIVASPHDNSLLQRALDQALADSTMTMAALRLDTKEVQEAALPALRRLVRWARTRGPQGDARSETFLLAHRLGMRGRIDVAWGQGGRVDTVAELKTGRDWNGRARVEHQLQVGAYGLMLAERGEADLREERLLLLYAGNTDDGHRPDLERQVPFKIQTFANIVHFRNRLVLIDLTGSATYQQQNRCRPCPVKHDCHRLTELLEEPRCVNGCVLGRDCRGEHVFDEAERSFFRHWVALLDREWRAINDATARLWRTDPSARCSDGSAASVVEVAPSADNALAYHLRIGNDCEIRQGDRVLLSEANGPAGGLVAQVEVLDVRGQQVDVLANEPLRFTPRWLDQYGSDRLFLRAYAGLYTWLAEPVERRSLVTALRPPRMGATRPRPRTDLPGGRQLNPLQEEALTQALGARDYLLVQGPPGSGKTEVIAALARQLTDEGRRVLLLAGTNRAIDRLLDACARLGLEKRFIRLGNRAEPGSIAERRLLSALSWDSARGETGPEPETSELEGILRSHEVSSAPSQEATRQAVQHARSLLFGSPIVAATIATLSSGPYVTLRGQFDTVVLDEASQVTLPAALGVLGFGQRFVLVGDHRQLPPVVQSSTDEEPGLSESLFEYLARARATDGQGGLILLEEQYRMNAEICAFPSQAWYEGKLRPAPSVAASRLSLSTADVVPSAHANLTRQTDETNESTVKTATQGSILAARRPPPAAGFLASILAPERPVIFVDVPGSTTNAPRCNRSEARLARLILESATRGGLAARDLAVIAPFRAQVALIRNELTQSDDEELRGFAHELADTVDRFQGSERQLIVYSFSSFGPELHPLMLDERRLNVALTRAKHKLILLGDLRVLRTYARFADLEAYCRRLYEDGSGVMSLDPRDLEMLATS